MDIVLTYKEIAMLKGHKIYDTKYKEHITIIEELKDHIVYMDASGNLGDIYDELDTSRFYRYEK